MRSTEVDEQARQGGNTVKQMKSRHGLTGQEGFTLIEVLVTALILGIAITGMTVLLSRGQMAVVTQGDARVALHLAEQKVERLRGLGFSAASLGNQTNGSVAPPDGCGRAEMNNEPCYNETGDSSLPLCSAWDPATNSGSCYNPALLAGAGQQLPSATLVDRQSFTRLTCVRSVQDDNPELPADPVEPPSAWTCPSCTPGAVMTCGPTGDKDCCSGSSRRIKVAVIPRVLGGVDPTMEIDPERATLEIVLTPTAKK